MAKSQMRTSEQERMLERWFLFFLDACKTAKRLNYGIAINHQHKSEMMDMMERAAEDENWPYGKDELPPLVVHRDVPPGQYMFVNKSTMEVLSSRAAMNGSKKGMGRFSKLWTPGEGIRRANG